MTPQQLEQRKKPARILTIDGCSIADCRLRITDMGPQTPASRLPNSIVQSNGLPHRELMRNVRRRSSEPAAWWLSRRRPSTGWGGDAFDARTVARIFEVKARPRFDPIIVPRGRSRAGWTGSPPTSPKHARKLADAFWPGPLTLVLPKNRCHPRPRHFRLAHGGRPYSGPSAGVGAVAGSGPPHRRPQRQSVSGSSAPTRPETRGPNNSASKSTISWTAVLAEVGVESSVSGAARPRGQRCCVPADCRSRRSNA